MANGSYFQFIVCIKLIKSTENICSFKYFPYLPQDWKFEIQKYDSLQIIYKYAIPIQNHKKNVSSAMFAKRDTRTTEKNAKFSIDTFKVYYY